MRPVLGFDEDGSDPQNVAGSHISAAGPGVHSVSGAELGCYEFVEFIKSPLVQMRLNFPEFWFRYFAFLIPDSCRYIPAPTKCGRHTKSQTPRTAIQADFSWGKYG
jgi:hypothetical protein